MLKAFGEALAHFYAPGQPSTTGFLMKNVACLIVNYAGGALPTKPTQGATPPAAGVSLKVVKGGTESIYTLADLETLDTITAPGTFTTSAGIDYSATYTGVPLATLIGNVPADATVRVTASDGYSMNYQAGMLLGRTEGTWILAYKENGAYMPSDPGPLRVVFVGEANPHFAELSLREDGRANRGPGNLRALLARPERRRDEDLHAGRARGGDRLPLPCGDGDRDEQGRDAHLHGASLVAAGRVRG